MIKGKKTILRLFNSEDEVRFYFNIFNNLEERSNLDHSEISSPVKVINSFSGSGWWSKDYGNLLITTIDGEMIGTISFSRISEYELSIGYRLLKEKDRGHGYMSEALSLFTDYLFETFPGIARLSLKTAEDNTPSRKLAEKCGFTLEGILRDAYFYRGKICNWTLYSKLKREWDKV